MTKVNRKNGQIESLEAADGSWWIMARGGKSAALLADDEDIRSIARGGDIRAQNTPYARRYVGYGAVASVVTPDEIIGTDEGCDGPIISTEAVERLAVL